MESGESELESEVEGDIEKDESETEKSERRNREQLPPIHLDRKTTHTV